MAIYHFNLQKKDQEVVTKIKNAAATPPQLTNLSNVVVPKPWGYEYLVYHTPSSEVWSLFIKHNQATSMHCHPNKKTALILLDGVAELTTLTKKGYS